MISPSPRKCLKLVLFCSLLITFLVAYVKVTVKEQVKEITVTTQQFWQTVTNDEMYVYSAYYDENSRAVKVIAVTNRTLDQRVDCRLRYYSEAFPEEKFTKAPIKFMQDHHDFPYGAAFILCPLPASVQPGDFPISVSILSELTFDSSLPASNSLKIHYPPAAPSIKFAVCVGPTYSYNNATRFLEWIEFHWKMGVKRFTFYNISIGPAVMCLIDKYRDLGLQIDVLPWGDPSDKIKSESTIRKTNQLAAINDCIYRHRGVAEYVINTDLDEFIIPHLKEDTSFEDLTRRIESLHPNPKLAIYEIRNAFFSPRYSRKTKISEDQDIRQNDNLQEQEDIIAANLVTLKYYVRMAEPSDIHDRSKYICKPLGMEEAGIHFAWDLVREYLAFPVAPEIALLHHYRPNYYPVEGVVQDLAAKNLSLKLDISNKVINAYRAFKDSCNIVM